MKNKTITEMLLNGIGTVAYMSGWIVWKLKKQIYLLTLIMIGMYLPLLVMQNVAFAPKAEAELNGYLKVEKPVTQRDQIIDYIYQVFGDQADNAFKVLACENHGLNPNAQGHNTDGSVDTGIFQVNSIHGVPASYLKNWRVNVDVAYQIYKGSGWGAWSCATIYHSLERSDTVK